MPGKHQPFHLVDAQEMARQFPATFEAPSQLELEALRPGVHVKVCIEFVRHNRPPAQGERFWVMLAEVGETLTGIIDNDLVFADLHGLVLGDQITFERRHVYQIIS